MPEPGPFDGARHRLVAGLLRRALAEQRRTCVLDCLDFPGEHELLGRDLSLLTLIDPDTRITAALRRRFGEAIVIETGLPLPFLARSRAVGERFDMILLPGLADRVGDAALAELLGEMVAALNRGGCAAIIGRVPAATSSGRSLSTLVHIFEQVAGPLDVSARREQGLFVLEGRLRA